MGAGGAGAGAGQSVGAGVEQDDVFAGVVVRRRDRLAQRAVGGVADAVAGVGGLGGDVDRRVKGGGQGQRQQCQQQRRGQTTDRDNHADHGGGSFELQSIRSTRAGFRVGF